MEIMGYLLTGVLIFYSCGSLRLISIMKKRERERPNVNINNILDKYQVTLNPLIIQEDCCICLNHYDVNSVIVRIPCNHIYHRECIHKWMLRRRTCPFCRVVIM